MKFQGQNWAEGSARAIVTPPISPDISATVVPGGKDGRCWRTANKKMIEIQGVAKRNQKD
jgi:hypothetical protein